MKTKDRILQHAKQLFNEQGFGNVTTAALAQSVGIAEGNLWYHFNNKRALVEAITLEFIESTGPRSKLWPQNDDAIISDYVTFLSAFAQELTDYSFLYRDQADYGEHSAALLEVLPKLYQDSQRQFRAFFAAMVRTGHLDWPEQQLDDLAINASILLRYGLTYFRESGQSGNRSTADTVRQVLMQHLTLFEHGLKPATAQQLRQAFSDVAEAA